MSYACLPLISRDGLVLVRYQFYCQKVINVWSGWFFHLAICVHHVVGTDYTGDLWCL